MTLPASAHQRASPETLLVGSWGLCSLQGLIQEKQLKGQVTVSAEYIPGSLALPLETCFSEALRVLPKVV